ncbi:DNA polymerase III subunit beta [Aneurinibacillus sp. Ricciae_BoGa-3]|uniref:DNA polymerase III subunit beta n=1 Tax=Aneurinibacillus sp. Ricciae_BoGa-3 TaxID=3022697 RepID=UPI00234097DF|nr:DNA polymerase III subunit beta [Aneurinibacillus sp. Ricciae_BoGa-3]WCK54527.1 DNA polymerase III subunit beta [Aneurinibacillus sp. Ricciae_BoGa-3]
MEFIIQRDLLTHAISTVSKAVTSRTTIPVLTGIKVVAHEDGITLTGSDSDISIEQFVQAESGDEQLIEIIKTGSIILPSRVFGEIVRKLPGDQVKISTNERFVITVASGRSEFNLNGMNAEDYPRLPQIEEDQVLSLPADLLKTMIRQTVFSVATNETRPILTGVMWKLEDSQLTFIATDSHRLTTRKASVESSAGLSFDNIVIPGKSLTELSRILPDDDKPVDIVITDNQILVKIGNILFYSRILDGTYPDTARIIPQNTKTEIVLSTKEFLGAIERASLLAKDGKNNVVRLFTQQDGTVEISSNTPEVGKVTEEVSPSSTEGEEVKISFNAKYMLDALRASDSPDIKIGFTGAMSPFIIRPTDHEWILHLILPVRTNQ